MFSWGKKIAQCQWANNNNQDHCPARSLKKTVFYVSSVDFHSLCYPSVTEYNFHQLCFYFFSENTSST